MTTKEGYAKTREIARILDVAQKFIPIGGVKLTTSGDIVVLTPQEAREQSEADDYFTEDEA